MTEDQQSASVEALREAIAIKHTQEALSMATGISQPQLSRYLRGEAAVSALAAVQIMAATGVHKSRFRPDLFDAPASAPSVRFKRGGRKAQPQNRAKG